MITSQAMPAPLPARNGVSKTTQIIAGRTLPTPWGRNSLTWTTEANPASRPRKSDTLSPSAACGLFRGRIRGGLADAVVLAEAC